MKLIATLAVTSAIFASQAFAGVQVLTLSGCKYNQVVTSSIRVTSANTGGLNRATTALQTFRGGKYKGCKVVGIQF